ncbi:hypothetical protein HDV63DRAFT_33719 [Trichoderma sp. SZMC 28014]
MSTAYRLAMAQAWAQALVIAMRCGTLPMVLYLSLYLKAREIREMHSSINSVAQLRELQSTARSILTDTPLPIEY